MYQLISIGNMYFKEWQDIYPVWVFDDAPGALDVAYKFRTDDEVARILRTFDGLPITITTKFEEGDE